MSWSYEKSLDRVEKHLENMAEIEIAELTKLANLDGLLTESRCRDIFGAHVYVDISNFSRLLSNEIYSKDDYKRLIRALHIYQSEITRIIEASNYFDGVCIHFQGAKVHALFYRPINNKELIATKAILLEIVVKYFVGYVFNAEFPHYEDFSVAGGADIGHAIGTRNGAHNDKELLFLGAPANHAAKIIGDHGQLRLTKNVYDCLPEALKKLCEPIECDEIYRVVSLNKIGDLEALLKQYGIDWECESSRERIKREIEKYPLKDISYSSADVLIDFDTLSIKNNKRISGVSIFADVTGFTNYVDAASTEANKKEALKAFHAIRKELAEVIKKDFDGVRVQYQGDRVQGLLHLPKDQEAAIALKAIELAAALHASMETVLKEKLPSIHDLSIAIGIDMGTTLASKLGARGQRDRICIGQAVENAARNEERISGKRTGISTRMYDLLSEYIQKLFVWDQSAKCYVAEADNLTPTKLALRQAKEVYDSGNSVHVSPIEKGIQISINPSPRSHEVKPSKPWSSER